MRNEEIIGKFAPLVAKLADRQVVSIPVLPGSAGAALAWSLQRETGRPIVWIADSPHSMESAQSDMLALCPCDGPAPDASSVGPESPVLYYPPRETPVPASRQPDTGAGGDPDLTGYRLKTLLDLAARRGGFNPTQVSGASGPGKEVRGIVTCVQALMQKTVPPDRLLAHTFFLRAGQESDMERLEAFLAGHGYEFGAEVQEKGAAAVRGGLIDVWSVTERWPVRVEFAHGAVESIRFFDPADQRSVQKVELIAIAPRDERPLAESERPAALSAVAEYLPEDSVLIWPDIESIGAHARLYEKLAEHLDASGFVLSFDELEAVIGKFGGARQVRMGSAVEHEENRISADVRPAPSVPGIRRDALDPDAVEGARRTLLEELVESANNGRTVVLFLETESARDHLMKEVEAVAAACPRAAENIRFRVGTLSGGFTSEALGLAVVCQAELYGLRKLQARRYDPYSRLKRPESGARAMISEHTEIEPGDLVVHVEHGIGRYLGLYEITVEGMRQEVMTIEYADNAKLHVPVSQAHLLSRYAGLSRRAVELHKLGGRRWRGDKAAAQRAIADLASALLETEAHRNVMKGHAFPPDTPWLHEFEAAFPYRETADQQQAIRAVKRHMESSRPMDLLVCGDSSYGKTEVAMRAAFKAAAVGKQVAMLVPTTVLAQQHFETFTRRMAAYPIRIEMLCRFRSRREHASVLEGLAGGAVDVVIGTHALLQQCVKFNDLGLVIIDEEQRFGVEHKERLKHVKRLVDVLTLTATPIPRTLYMSMTGARDIARIETPPRERVPIETTVTRGDDDVVRQAILRELNRGGQVFFLHNRVMTIERVRDRLQKLVPEARIEIAHGQMPSAALSETMRGFVAGEFDVLLCTTIIESGVDIPRVNTIVIDRADRFGIADLYQLRGRVGRAGKKGYAYFLLPQKGDIDPDARRRIAALRQHAGHGSGFRLAMRDLDIRGAGNLLGGEQSGHIAAIGFGLYCQLLKRTVARLKGDIAPPVIDVDVRLDFISFSPVESEAGNAAVIPHGYIEDERLRIETYRRISEASSSEELASERGELADKFGPVPRSVERLLKIAGVRILAAGRRITRIETRDDKVQLVRNRDLIMIPGPQGRRLPRLAGRTADDRLDELAALIESLA